MSQFDYLYDGSGGYATITDDNAVLSDDISELHVFVENFSAYSSATLSDTVTLSTITVVPEDPGYLLLKLPAIVIDGLSATKAMTVDDETNLICLSYNFLWHISPAGEVLSKRFLDPCITDFGESTIKYIKYYEGFLYVLHYDVIPSDNYMVIREFVGATDSLNAVRNHSIPTRVDPPEFIPWELRNPPDQFLMEYVPSYGIYRLAKYNVATGESLSSIYIQIGSMSLSSATNGFLLSPVSFDILDDKLLIMDNGDASVKTYELASGIFLGRILDSEVLFAPYGFFLESSEYAWVADKSKNTNMGVTDFVNKINLNYGYVEESHPLSQKAQFYLVKSANFTSTFLLLRDGQNYKIYRDFVLSPQLSDLINGHAIQSIQIASSTNLYIWNNAPFDIRQINLADNTTSNFRDCYEPITIIKELIDDNKVILTDAGLQEVGIYRMSGERDGVLVDHVQPHGITKVGTEYYITNIHDTAIERFANGNLTRLTNFDIIRPVDITSDGTLLYVTDCGNNAVIVMNTDGVTQFIIGKNGVEDGMFIYPLGCVISNNELFVLDSGNFRVQVFSLNGVFKRKFVLSPMQEPRLTNKYAASSITSDVNDSIERLDGSQEVWGNLTVASSTPMAAFSFALTVPNGAQIVSAFFKAEKLSTLASQMWVMVEKTAFAGTLAVSVPGTYNILYRDKFSPSNWSVPTGLGIVASPSITSAIQQLVSLPDWQIGMLCTIILQTNSANAVTVKAMTASLEVNYNIVKPVRRNGLYHHIVVDTDNVYVSDIAANAIVSLDKITGVVKDSYRFLGTTMDKTAEDIFITNMNCNISYLQKYQFNVGAYYDLEFDSQSDKTTYLFEPSWEASFTEDFAHQMSIDQIETFEWVGSITWEEVQSVYEFDLSTDAIVWVEAQ